MKISCLPLLYLALAAPALAQSGTTSASPSGSSSASASALDLSVPQESIKYRSDPGYSADPPGTFYGDKSGKPAPAATGTESVAQTDQCQGKLHGSVSTGFGYASRGGNSNWQAANLNSCKTYYDDDGDAHQIGISISVGRGEGPGFYGRGPGWGGPYGW